LWHTRTQQYRRRGWSKGEESFPRWSLVKRPSTKSQRLAEEEEEPPIGKSLTSLPLSLSASHSSAWRSLWVPLLLVPAPEGLFFPLQRVVPRDAGDAQRGPQRGFATISARSASSSPLPHSATEATHSGPLPRYLPPHLLLLTLDVTLLGAA
jgi:hypothetical protein